MFRSQVSQRSESKEQMTNRNTTFGTIPAPGTGGICLLGIVFRSSDLNFWRRMPSSKFSEPGIALTISERCPEEGGTKKRNTYPRLKVEPPLFGICFASPKRQTSYVYLTRYISIYGEAASLEYVLSSILRQAGVQQFLPLAFWSEPVGVK